MKLSVSLLTVAGILAATTACKSATPWNSDEVADVDNSLLAYVSDSEQSKISEMRATRDHLADKLAYAKRDVERAKNDLEIAKQEMDVVEAEHQEAELRVDVAKGRTAEDLRAAKDNLHEVESYRRWVAAKIAECEAGVQEAEREATLRQAQLDLAEGRVELAKAKAVHDLDRPDVAKIDVDAYQRAVDEEELAAADAQVEYDAARQKVQYRSKLTEERASAVPARFRSDGGDSDGGDHTAGKSTSDGNHQG